MKNTFPKLFLRSSLLLSLLVSTTCKKLEKSLLVSTGEVTYITNNAADAPGTIIDLADGATQHGHCYGKTPNLSTTGTKTELGVPPGTGGYTSQLTNLEPGTKYYVKAYLSDGTETVYGKELSFTTISGSVVIISTADFSSVTATSLVSGGNISSDGGNPITARGVCWGISSSPTVTGSKTTDGTGTGPFVSNLSGLSANTTYYVRAYATNSTGTSYGNERFITTNSLSVVVPTLFTKTVSGVTSTSAKSGGTISSNGGAEVTVKGVCWSKTANPTTLDPKTTDGAGNDAFASNLTGLSPSTNYHVRAYATNSKGTAYGEDLSFNTAAVAAVVPTLTTTAYTSLTTNSAVSGGNISSDGGATVTSRGVCWSITTGPTINSSKTIDGTGPDAFVSSITGLSANTKYYFRAYATNSAGTAYGNELNLTTTKVTVLAPSNLTALAQSGSAILLSWTDNSNNEDGFRIERSPDGGNWSEIFVTGSNASSYENSGLSTSTIYYYRVRAYKGSEYSGFSNTANATTKANKAILHVVNNSHYDLIDIQLKGSQYVTTPGVSMEVGESYDFVFDATEEVSFYLGIGFWDGSNRDVWFFYSGVTNVTVGSTTNLTFNNPTLEQILTNFGSSRNWSGVYYDVYSFYHEAGFKFTNTGGWSLYDDGVFQTSGTVTLVSWPDYATTIEFKTCTTCNTIQLEFPFTSFLYRNGPLSWPVIEYFAE